MPLSLADVLSAQAGGGPVYEGGPDANVTLGGVLSALGSTWPARIGQDIVQGAMAPGNAYRSTPENPVTTEQMIGPAANLAMLMVGAPGGSGGVGSGARSFSERMAEAQDIAFQRAQRGQATGDYGLGIARRTAPEAAAGTPEYSSDRLMSSLRDTQAQLQEYKNPQKPLLAPGESPEDFALFSGGNTRAGKLLAGIRAYHGSPYDFEKFDLSKIGTGEGAQSYGHGLYFAENPAVAQDYRNNLGGVSSVEINGQPIWSQGQSVLGRVDLPKDQQLALDAITRFPNPKEAANFLSTRSPQYERPGFHEERQKAIALLENGNVTPKIAGKMYEVNINAEPGQFLNWDAPLSQQSPQVQKAITPKLISHPWLERSQIPDTTGQDLYYLARNKNPAVTSQAFNEAGIPGIRYLDQGSRAQATRAGRLIKNPVQEALDAINPQTTSNYVVFNPEIVDILKKYGLAGLTMGGVLSAAGQPPASSQ